MATKSGSKTVTTHGTPVALKSSRTPANWVTIQASTANTGLVYIVGGPTDPTSTGVELIAGGVFKMESGPAPNPYDLAKIYIDTEVDAEGVKFLYEEF